MELDTGASVSIISQDTYNKLWTKNASSFFHKVRYATLNLLGEKLPLLGTINVDVHCNDQTAKFPLVVVWGVVPVFFDKTG